MKELTTANGTIIPPVGLGTYPFQGRQMADIVKEAFKIGYRLIDTSDDYRGESGIGLGVSEAVKEGIVKREDVFLQTKVSQDNAYADEPLEGMYFNRFSPFMQRHTVDELVREKVATSLEEMKTDYIDSLLIHYPFPGYIEEIWETMMALKKEGKVRYIGVSNFHAHHIDLLKKKGETPSINQIYISPMNVQKDMVDYAERVALRLMTYSPLMDLRQGKIDLNVIAPIAAKYQKSGAQIILRWNIEIGSIPLPRSSKVERMKQNFDVLDFHLSREEVETISSLHRDDQYLVQSKLCPGI